ncbi:MAG: hypothetical protein MI923_06880 [Phycisphaerales bacterium]|nr:hypothetical protein [Phycisphaerales bacterium]
MSRKVTSLRVAGLLLTILVATATTGECDTNMMPDDPNNPGDPGDPGNLASSLSVILSGVSMIDGIKAGNDLIAMGVTGPGVTGGVQYIKPSQGPDANIISNFHTFMTGGFNIAGTWIATRDFNGNVFFYDTATDTFIEVDEDDLALNSGATTDKDEFWAEGTHMVTRTDTARVADGHKLKMIDFSQNPPVITSFTQDFPDQQGTTQEVPIIAVDEERMQFVVLQLDIFYLYDMNDPDAAPTTFNTGGDGGATNATQPYFDDGYVIYHDRQGASNGRRVTRMLNVDTGEITQLSENPSAIWDVILVNGVFGYFVKETEDDEIDNFISRSVWGTVNGTISYTNTNETDILIVPPDRETGLVGYGQTMAVTPDLRFRFIAGGGSQGNANYLQVSAGAGFAVIPTLPEFANVDPNGLEASEVVTSNTICAFKTLFNNQLAYIILPPAN